MKIQHICRAKRAACLVALFSGLVTHLAIGAEYFVAVDGSDANPGTREKPLASAAGARDLIRKSGRAGKEAITVSFGPGSYYLGETLVFEPEDSGTEQAPITYESAEEGKAVLSGGKRLALNWEAWKDGVMKAQTPRGLVFDELFVDGVLQPMARYPNYDGAISPYNGFAADAFSQERAARWKNPAGGYIHAMHRALWGGYHYRITGKDAKGEVTYEGGWQNNRQMGMHPKFRFVENIFEELDAPGEWYQDRESNTLYYYPPKGVEVSQARVEAGLLLKLIEFAGSREKPVKWITLKGFTFRHAARSFMLNKEPLLRSDWTIYRGGAVTLSGACDCGIIDSNFEQPGGNAVFVNRWARRIKVRGCLFKDVGASGVAFVGAPGSVRSPLFEYNQRQSYAEVDKTPGPKSEEYPSDCVVEDCLMAGTGRIEKQGAGVQISMSQRITVRHCTIYDTSRSGININEGTFGGHVIEFCDIFDTVKETGDHGSFNSWGRDRYWGLKEAPAGELAQLAKLDMVEPNILRNSRWRCDHGWDIDLDDGSSCYQIYNNLLLHGGLKLREGFHRTVYNNIMVNNTFHPHVWFKESDDVFTNNIVMAAYRPAAMNNGMKWGREVDYNIFASNDADRRRFAAQGCDGHSIVAEVKFVAPEKGDFRVKDECRAVFALGFKNFPMDQFGVVKPSLKARARAPLMPEAEGVAAGTDSVRAKEPQTASQGEFVWQQARFKPLEGEEFSAYGVSREEGGVAVLEVPRGSVAGSMGLKAGDLVQKINGQKVANAGDLVRSTGAAAGKPMTLGVVRNQQAQTLQAERYIYCVVESAKSADFKVVRVKKPEECAAIKAVTARLKTNNDPLSTLYDGRVAEGYGPVFGNGVTGGCYKVDLGEVRDVASISSWSFNQGERRATQRFVVYGSASEADPGWDLAKFGVVAEVSADIGAGAKYLGSRVQQSGGGSLGKYRWLIWKTVPVTAQKENTAFQEFQVETTKTN